MSLPEEIPLKKLQFYVTTPYVCGYLPGKLAQSLIAAPQHLVNAEVYGDLVNQGFRRSGKFTYRPHCENCSACVPARVIVDKFTPSRSQKRAFKQHLDLDVRIVPLGFHQSHFELYCSYQAARHADTDILNKNNRLDEVDQYRQFLCMSNVESLLVEFRDSKHQVKMVSVIDVIQDGVSAVYTFYEASDRASYGTYSIMWLIEWTKRLELPYLYLGYWIKDSQKMSYKQNFQPQEKLTNGEWKQ